MINLDGSPLESVHFMVCPSRKKIYAKDKNIRGQGVPLSHSYSRLETRSVPSIN